MNRRDFLKSALAATAAAGLARIGFAASGGARTATADAMILIWLPGGVAQTDTWDPKQHTPFTPGMKGSDVLGTCPLIATAAAGVSFGAGLENIASVMGRGAVLRSLTNDAPFGDVHLKAQYHMMSGYRFPAGVRAPSMGSVVVRALGRRDPRVPAYVAIGRWAQAPSPESTFMDECRGPGFYGPQYAPLRAPDVSSFDAGCAMAGRLVEAGARFVQVEYPYEAFGGFDAHEYGARRIMEMKRRIDAPIGQLVRDLDARGLLDGTLVVVASEFGRSIADDGVIRDESRYGFHGHFSAASSMLFFGGGFKRGFAYGRTAERHPMVAVENPVRLEDVHATIYAALGIAPDAHYTHDGKPIYVTNGGRPIDALLA
jgi:hypothetical protein